MPFYDARMPVYSWMSGPVTTNMYQFDEHNVWIRTTNCSDRIVYPSLSLLMTLLSARGLAHCSTHYVCLFPSPLRLSNFLTWSA